MKRKVPILAVILIIAALIWFFSELYNININIQWIPLILIIVAVGWIFNRLVL